MSGFFRVSRGATNGYGCRVGSFHFYETIMMGETDPCGSLAKSSIPLVFTPFCESGASSRATDGLSTSSAPSRFFFFCLLFSHFSHLFAHSSTRSSLLFFSTFAGSSFLLPFFIFFTARSPQLSLGQQISSPLVFFSPRNDISWTNPPTVRHLSFKLKSFTIAHRFLLSPFC